MDYTNVINTPLKKESSFLDKMDYAVIFLLIYISSSFYMLTKPGMLALGLLYGCVFVLFVISMLGGRKIVINSNVATKFLTLIAIIAFGTLSARGDDSKQTIINISNILIAYLFSLNYKFDDYIKKFANIIYFLCLFSIVVYCINIIFPQIFEVFPEVVNVRGRSVNNLFFTTIYPSSVVRNQGLFWEPGAFQTYICLSLLFELFYFKNVSKKRLIVYAATLVTTFSTAGYVTALFIVYTYVTQLLLSTSGESKNSTRNLFFILTIVVVAIIVFLSMENNVAEHVFGKLETYRENVNTRSTTSAGVRFDAFIRPFKIFWQYPMLGAGTRGMTNFALIERYSMNTCTFINWFAYFGIFFGGMMMQMYYKFAKRFSNNRLIVLMIFFVLFLATATENYYRNPSILIFAFFPVINNEKSEEIENPAEHQ